MKNGTHFNRLTMIDSSADEVDDPAAYYPYQSGAEMIVPGRNDQQEKTTLLVYTAVSIACATAAIASGTYAALLLRHQAARQALTDVNDILRSCQSRMRQLEADVQRLPGRQA